MKLLKYVLITVMVCSMGVLHAQQIPSNIENLSNQQILELISQFQVSGLSEEDFEIKLLEKGFTANQILLLKKRVASLNTSVILNNSSKISNTDSYLERIGMLTKKPSLKRRDSIGGLRVFGEEIFENVNLSFEPNLSISAPKNYIIGVNDQLVIDVFGLSETTKKLKVNTEGFIRYPNLGPIKVAGHTLEDAQLKIKKSLTKLYPAINSGATLVQVSVGQIRSIRVTLIGEVKQPGSYSVSSLSTLMNALYASGGPNEIGSFRKIDLVRNGKITVTFDLYDFLLKGDLSKNILLQDEDVIRIHPFEIRVAVMGAIKKSALFDVTNNESASDIVHYAGGVSPLGFKDLVRVKRLGTTNKEIITVSTAQLSTFHLQSGDTLVIDSLANYFVNRVQIKGAVYYPGEYSNSSLPTLFDLLNVAKPKEGAYFDRGLLRRLKSDYTSELINFNLADVMNKKIEIKLEREDSIHIYQVKDLRERYTVSISGEVNEPSTYDYSEKMRVEDLVLIAGGYKDGADLHKIEVSRRLPKSANETLVYSIIKEIDLLNRNKDDLEFSLQPFDVISVRKSPSYKEQIHVRIEGEILYSGNYTLEGRQERISDIVRRAGGLKADAFAEGAVLIRQSFLGNSAPDSVLFNIKSNLMTPLIELNQKGAIADTQQLNRIKQNFYRQQKLVGINLSKAIQTPGSAFDLILNEGDILKIPGEIQTVQAFGAIKAQKQIGYTNGMSFISLIQQSGGFAMNAARRHSYAVYANGEAQSTKVFLFFKQYPKVKPGVEIFVPLKKESRRLSSGEIIGIGSGIASMAGLIIALLNATK